MIQFDTDVLVFVERGNIKASAAVESAERRLISVQTYMEFIQAANDKAQSRRAQSFLKEYEFLILPLTENIGHRASVYVEEFSLSHSMRAGDAIVAATAVENGITLLSANGKHFKQIKELRFKLFRP